MNLGHVALDYQPRTFLNVKELLRKTAKRDDLHSRRLAASFLMTPDSMKKLFEKLGTRFGRRNGGYTRMVKLGWRKGDGAE
jgi:ribosomal protein L17